jgi:hypothetical protein
MGNPDTIVYSKSQIFQEILRAAREVEERISARLRVVEDGIAPL